MLTGVKQGCRFGAVWLTLCAGAAAVADGVVIAPTATVKVAIPDQEALIWFQDGIQTLAIETRFVGPGEDFAWIVPLPAVPEVTAVSQGTFPTLRALFQPSVVHNVFPCFVLAVLISIPAGLILLRKLKLLLCLVILAWLSSYLLLSLGVAGSGGSTGGQAAVHVHDRQMVGSYEVATISSEDPLALGDWLRDWGFVMADRQESVVKSYVEQGWKFVAVRLLRTEDSDQRRAVHPLAFTFPTSLPVYPLRLTGTTEGPCRIDLYVFGSHRAEIPGFETVHCAQVGYGGPEGDPDDHGNWSSPLVSENRIPIGHPGIRGLTRQAPVATKLSATLLPEQMTTDALVTWKPFLRQKQAVYSRQGTFTIVANWCISAFCLMALSLLWARSTGRMTRSASLKAAAAGALALLVAGGGVRMLWPTEDVQLTYSPQTRNASAHRDIAASIAYFEHGLPEDATTVEWVRKRVDHLLNSPDSPVGDYRMHWNRNPFTGGPRVEEDSPGNYTVRPAGRKPAYVWYDGFGGEHVELLDGITIDRSASQPDPGAGAESLWYDRDRGECGVRLAALAK